MAIAGVVVQVADVEVVGRRLEERDLAVLEPGDLAQHLEAARGRAGTTSGSSTPVRAGGRRPAVAEVRVAQSDERAGPGCSAAASWPSAVGHVDQVGPTEGNGPLLGAIVGAAAWGLPSCGMGAPRWRRSTVLAALVAGAHTARSRPAGLSASGAAPPRPATRTPASQPAANVSTSTRAPTSQDGL